MGGRLAGRGPQDELDLDDPEEPRGEMLHAVPGGLRLTRIAPRALSVDPKQTVPVPLPGSPAGFSTD